MTDVPVLLLTGRGSRRLEAEALDVAAGLLCRSGDRSTACNDCRRVARREHPDLLVAAPEASRRANTPAFDESSTSKETTIPTALVRALASDAFRNPYEAALRVLVLLDVDRTEAAAFSALLKVLEEPPSRARFVLTAARPRLLPPTILSRLVLRRLPSPSRETLVASLVARGMSPEEAAARAAFRPAGEEEALDLDLAGERASRDALLEAASGLFLSGASGLGARPGREAGCRRCRRDGRSLRPPCPDPAGRGGRRDGPGGSDGPPRRALQGPGTPLGSRDRRPPRGREPGPPRGRRPARLAPESPPGGRGLRPLAPLPLRPSEKKEGGTRGERRAPPRALTGGSYFSSSMTTSMAAPGLQLDRPPSSFRTPGEPPSRRAFPGFTRSPRLSSPSSSAVPT